MLTAILDIKEPPSDEDDKVDYETGPEDFVKEQQEKILREVCLQSSCSWTTVKQNSIWRFINFYSPLYYFVYAGH